MLIRSIRLRVPKSGRCAMGLRFVFLVLNPI